LAKETQFTFRLQTGHDIPTVVTNRQVQALTTEDFLAQHPVFTLEQLAGAMGRGKDTAAALERVKHHLRQGRLKRVAKELYAAVPRGMSSDDFVPDRYLVAAAARADGILSHHAALELLGVAHSEANVCTALCSARRFQSGLEAGGSGSFPIPRLFVERGPSVSVCGARSEWGDPSTSRGQSAHSSMASASLAS